jgi:hypothetical protein
MERVVREAREEAEAALHAELHGFPERWSCPICIGLVLDLSAERAGER